MMKKRFGLPPVPPIGPGAPARRSLTKKKDKDYTPVSWDKYFESSFDEDLGDGDTFRVYSCGSEGPVLLFLHGGGFSALSWALLSAQVTEMVKCRCIAVDLRGHGDTVTEDETDLSAEKLSSDIGRLVSHMYRDDPPPIVLVGHSMGGAIAVHVASKELIPSLIGLAVLDVVEGTALDALSSMQSFLRSRPQYFESVEWAIEWAVRTGHISNLESARVSMIGQVKSLPTHQSSSDAIEELRASVSDVIKEEIEEEIGEEDEGQPSPSTTNSQDATQSKERKYTWRIDLSKTEPFWKGWFQGLSQKFLSCTAPKMLIIAGADRLDKDLTIGQMQGKFQMNILSQSGHAVHEDAPDKVALILASFLLRQKATEAMTGFESVFPATRKNASCIWKMMTRCGPGLARCNICRREFNCLQGTSNLLRHIKSKHSETPTISEAPILVKQIKSKHATTKTVSEDNPTERSVQQGNLPKERNPPKQENLPNNNHVPVTQITPASAIGRVTKYRPDSQKKKALDQKLFAMIFKDMQPFSVVEDSGFRDFCLEMDAQYELPSRRQVKRALPSAYDEKKTALIEMLDKVDSVAITTDSWTSLNMQSFLTVTAHFYEPLPSWKLHSTVLATRPDDKNGSSAKGMAEIINNVLQEFNIRGKITAAITDNTSAMVNLVKDHLKVFHVRCLADSLNLIVKDANKSTEGFCSIVDNVKAIVNHFNKRANATARLQFVMSNLGMTSLKLIQEVPTHWKSTLKMLRRYIQLHRAVSETLTNLGRTDLIISDQKVEEMEGWCESLEPFEEATEMMSTEKQTSLSQILVVVRQLQMFLATKSSKIALSNNLLNGISDRFQSFDEGFTGAAATLLDPRFKSLPFTDDDLRKRHEERIIDMMEPLFTIKDKESSEDDAEPAAKKRSFMESFFAKVNEVDKRSPEQLTGPREELKKYMSMKYLELRKDPNLWWQEHAALFPHLSAIARKFCFIPATSVPSERLFSEAGELVLRKRSCLKPSTIDMVLFMNQQ